MSSKSYYLITLALCMLSLAGSLPLTAGEKTQTLPAIKPAFTAPAFALRDIDGKMHRLSDYRGKLVILNFWATWCPPCRDEMPSMERARQKSQGDNIVILAVNVGEDEATIFEFTGSYPVEFPLLMDNAGQTVKRYPVTGLPTTYIIDPRGKVSHRAIGSREWDHPSILDELRALASVTGP